MSLLRSEAMVAKHMFASMAHITTQNEVLQCLSNMKVAFPNLITFVRLVLTIPVSSAGAERSFSVMKRVKTFLRSTMTCDRLNSLCILSIERELSQQLINDPTQMVDRFAIAGKRRLLL